MSRASARGFTLIELLIVVAIIGVVAALAVPGLFRARMSANETSAIASVRSINSSQMNFAANCGQGTFAASLEALGTKPLMGGDPFLDEQLSIDPARKNGYVVTLFPGEAPSFDPMVCNETETAISYAVTADPAAVGGTGNRHFFSNGHTIWADMDPIEVVQTGSPSTGTPIQ